MQDRYGSYCIKSVKGRFKESERTINRQDAVSEASLGLSLLSTTVGLLALLNRKPRR